MASPNVSQKKPMTLICGPCVIESEELLLEVAENIDKQLGPMIEAGQIELYFKASFDKANRTAIDGFRGPGIDAGLKLLNKVKEKYKYNICTDLHDASQANAVAAVADVVQVPAFLCRQTDLVIAATEAALKFNRRLNIKKGQFLAPWDAANIIDKVTSVQKKLSITPSRPDWFTITERGTSFGYNCLVVDMISFQTIQSYGVPVIYDATHSIQVPGAGAGGKSTGGKREYLEVLARSAFAAGANGLFMEVHPRPSEAKSDGPNAFYLEYLKEFIGQILKIKDLCASMPLLLPEVRK